MNPVRRKLTSAAQSRALWQLRCEHGLEYRQFINTLLRAGYRHNNVPGGPKAQAAALIELSKRYPHRYRELYQHFRAKLFQEAGESLDHVGR